MKSLVILHGWAGERKRWQKFKKQMEKRGWRVFLPALPGFGQEKIVQPWTLADYCQWLENFLQKKGLKKIFLLGHSFGGRLTLKFASQEPKNLKGIILVNSAGLKKKFNFKKIFFWPVAKIGKLIFFLPPFCLFKKPGRWLFYKLVGERDYYQADKVMRQTLKKVLREDLSRLLKRIKIPTLLVWGGKDKITPLKDGCLFKSEIANSRLIVYDREGHGLPFKKSRRLAGDIDKFYNDVFA